MIKNIEGTTIRANIEDEQFELPEEIRRKIEKFWNQCKLENPKRNYLKTLLEIDSKEKEIEQAER